MKEEEKLLREVGRDTGFRVPEGYFDDFQKRMEVKLPPYPAKPLAEKLSTWKRISPYIYLAAMFCGIWLMMKMFTDLSGAGEVNTDTVPQNVVIAMSDNPTADYVVEIESSDDGDFQIEEEVCAQYDSMEDFREDFGYNLRPEYENADVRG